MKRTIGFLCLSGILLLTGCTRISAPPDILNTEPVLSTARPGAAMVATSTTTEPFNTPAQLLKPTDTYTPEPGIIQNCLATQPNLPDKFKERGVILFETYGPKVSNSVSFYDFQTGKLTQKNGRNYRDVSISPNRTMFAYENRDLKQLDIFSSDGKKIKSVALRKYWAGIAQWLDNQQLVIVMEEPEPSEEKFALLVKTPRTVVIVNPFTNQVQIFPANYPNIDLAEKFGWDQGTTTVYDPTLTRVVYPGELDQGHNGYTLYNIPDKKKLAQIPNPRWVGRRPVWSPDGSQFIVMGDDEFYLVSYDGKISRLTHLNPGFNFETREGGRFEPTYYNWSPDGKNIAFWLEASETNRRTLAILDIETGKVTDTCITAGYAPGNITTVPYPVWSPDGKSLVVAANYERDDDEYDVLAVDLQNDLAYKITRNVFPVGWLISPK